MQNKLRYVGKRVCVQSGTRIPWKCTISPSQGGGVSIGKNCEFHDYALVLSYGGNIIIGDHCSINPFTVLYGHGGLKIGSGVRIAAHVVMVPANHTPGDEGKPLYQREVTAQGIEIGDYAWIGAGARILDGVRIGRHAIIGAGSVVNSDVPDYAIAAGVPARVLSQREHGADISSTWTDKK